MKTRTTLLLLVVALLLSFGYSSEENIKDSNFDLVVNDTISANVYFRCGIAGGFNFYEECDSYSIGGGVEDVIITAEEYPLGGVINTAISGIEGSFAISIPQNGYIRYKVDLPSRFSEVPLSYSSWGMTPYDISVLMQHIARTRYLDCPYGRIAADFNYDGRIDSLDGNLMSQVLDEAVGELDTSYNFDRWLMLPRVLSTNTILHPDPQFVSDYWNVSHQNDDHLTFPMVSNLELNGDQYVYYDSCSWNGTVKKWETSGIINNCEIFNYGFWLIKKGDLKGCNNCQGNSNDFTIVLTGDSSNVACSSAPMDLSLSPSNSSNSSNLKGKIKIKSEKQVDFYQLKIGIDTAKWKLLAISHFEEDKNRAYSFLLNNGSALNTGILNGYWVNKLKDGFILDCKDGCETFSFSVEAKDNTNQIFSIDDISIIGDQEVGGGGELYDDYQILIELD